MGLQQKLEREYQRGFNDGRKQSNETAMRMAELKGAAMGAAETWDLFEEMIPKLKGVGPKTQQKLLKAVQEFANVEKMKLMRTMK